MSTTEIETPPTALPVSHRDRARALVQAHPEVKELMGRNPVSAVIVGLIVAVQIAVAWAVRDSSLLVILGVAAVVGAFANLALSVLIHEAGHQLVFAKKARNYLLAIAANLPLVIPYAIPFIVYHVWHHAYLGVYDRDGDVPTRWEQRLLEGNGLARAAWLLLFPVLQSARALRLDGGRKLRDPWVTLNTVVQFAFNIAVFVVLGWGGLLYLLAGTLFAFGLHPLGARLIQEHFVLKEDQETYSYYGAGNILALNIGYHNEHHDMVAVPWNRLPELRKMAPEYYEPLLSHPSWIRLWFRFLFQSRPGGWARLVHPPVEKKGAAARQG